MKKGARGFGYELFFNGIWITKGGKWGKKSWQVTLHNLWTLPYKNPKFQGSYLVPAPLPQNN